MNASQLLILGNGFDVHCGLRSTYKDFFYSAILDTIGGRFDLMQLQAEVCDFWESLLLEYYMLNKKDDYNWCDIEKIIKDTLFSVFTQKKYGGTELWEIGYRTASSNQTNEFKLGITSETIDFFLYKYCTDFFRRSMSQAETAKQDFLFHLLQQLNNLERRFCGYLKSQIFTQNNFNKLNQKYIINSVNLLARLTGFVYYKFNKLDDFITFQSKKRLIDVFDNLKNVYILSFNYTAIFDILDVQKPCAYNNVHGKLCNGLCVNDCQASSVIFGVDDSLIQTQASNSELRLFSKTYRKMFSDEYSIKTLPPNNNQVQIKFYGHSLSEADYSYFQSIFDYYDLYGNSKVSLIFFYSKGYEQHDAIYRLISEYGKSLTNKEQGKNLIHKLLLENRLRIQDIEDYL